MGKLKVQKTTYEVDGCIEPCFVVSDESGYTQVRIATCYHIIGSNTLFLTEFLGGERNNMEEWEGDFSSLTPQQAVKLAKKFSVYL